jgi:SAM-dependent methyltransferase
VIADLESVRQLPARADAIVLADILEHLRDPSALLSCVRQSLTPDGHLFVSVPNIANVTVRLGLLFGIFEYRERGILDSSHLRFYTMRSIKREIESAGFRLIAFRGSSVPIRLIVPKAPEFLLRVGERMLTIVTRIWRGLFAYQIIIVARRR